MYIYYVSVPKFDAVVGPFEKRPTPVELLDAIGYDHPEVADRLEEEGYSKKPVHKWSTAMHFEPGEEVHSYEL